MRSNGLWAPALRRYPRGRAALNKRGWPDCRDSIKGVSLAPLRLRCKHGSCATLSKTRGDGSTDWSCRKLAQELGISKTTVQRVLAQAKLRPHRLDRYMASNDPDFEQKAADIIGLYMNPPQQAAVFCVDEKTALQALDRLDPVLYCRCPPAEPSGMGLSTTATARCRYTRHSMSRPAGWKAKRPSAMPAPTSLRS